MALAFKKGDSVRQVVPAVQGIVTGMQIIGDEVQYLVQWTGLDGETVERAFTETQIEAAPRA